MTFSIIDFAKERTLEDVLFILDVLRKDRYFLNKHFQNSICNYFLEDYAGNFLKDSLGIPRAKEITRYISQTYEEMKGTKYMKLMYGYISELEKAGKLAAFKQQLCENMQATLDTNISSNFKQSKEWQTAVWKRAFSLFVYYVCSHPEQQIKGIFEIWNALFPNNKIFRKRQQNVSHRDEKSSSDPSESEKLQNEPCISHVQNEKSELQNLTPEQSHQIDQLNELFFGGEFNKNCCLPADNGYPIKSKDSYDNQQDVLQNPPIQVSYIKADQQNNYKHTDLLENYCSEINSSDDQGFSFPQLQPINEGYADEQISYQHLSHVIQNQPYSQQYDHHELLQIDQNKVFFEQGCLIQSEPQNQQWIQSCSDDQFAFEGQEQFLFQQQNIEDQENSMRSLVRVSSNQFFPVSNQNNQQLEIDEELEALERVQLFYSNNSLENYNQAIESLKKFYEAY